MITAEAGREKSTLATPTCQAEPRETVMCPSCAAPALFALLVDAAAEDREVPLEICRAGGFLGVGWEMGSEPLDWPSYQRRAIERDGVVHAAVQEIYDLPAGALIWTRDPDDGVYYLAKVTGPWQYLRGDAAESSRMHNVRRVRMVACDSTSQVPSSIVGCFVGGWVIQRIYDEVVARQSASLFAELTGEWGGGRPTLDDVLTSYLDDRDVLDLVRAYLHRTFGYLIRRPARRRTVAGSEDVLRDSFGREAVVRARRGGSAVSCIAASLATGAVDQVFVFSPTGTYGPNLAPNVTQIDRDDVIEFMRGERRILPPGVRHWVSRASDDVPLHARRRSVLGEEGADCADDVPARRGENGCPPALMT